MISDVQMNMETGCWVSEVRHTSSALVLRLALRRLVLVRSFRYMQVMTVGFKNILMISTRFRSGLMQLVILNEVQLVENRPNASIHTGRDTPLHAIQGHGRSGQVEGLKHSEAQTRDGPADQRGRPTIRTPS